MNEERVYLLHIAEAIATIQDYVSTGRDDFFAKRMIQDAVIRNLEIIGEAVKNIFPVTCQGTPEVPWQKIADLRDVLYMIILGLILKVSGPLC